MVLSIGMIVKNEEKYLERCLTALRPILDSIDSELIIADTGSTDNTVEIAKRFTDKVYFFEWTNDFSAARNYTMEKSQGDWYMFIDADEILQDCSDIIHFFKSGEYLRFGMASYIQRSFVDAADNESISDFRVLRLTKRFNDVAFVNPIHEALTPTYDPIKHLDLIAEHYGYIYQNNGVVTELAKKKSERNLNVLLKELDKFDNSKIEQFMIYNNIADCYEIIDKPEEALKFIEMGLTFLDHSHIAICSYYSHEAYLLLRLKKYDKAIEICNEYFSKKNIARNGNLATDISMYAVRSNAFFRNGITDKSIEDMIAFFSVYNKYTNNRLCTDDLLYSDVKVTNKNINKLYDIFLMSCIKEHRFNTAQEYISAFQIEDFQNSREYIFNHLCLRAIIMENTSYNEIIILYDKLDDYNKEQFIRILRWNVFKSNKREEILKNLSAISNKNKKLSDITDIYNDFFIHNEADSRKIEHFISEYGTENNADILCIMMSMDMDITPFVTSPDFNAAKCIHLIFVDYMDYQKCFSTYNISKISPKGLAKGAEVYGRAMFESQKQKKGISKLFRIYGKIGSRWLSEFDGETNIPSDIRAAAIADSITSAQDNKDYKLCINEMRRLIKTFPEFAPLVKEYQESVKKEAQPVQNKSYEFAEMAAAVKRSIYNMINTGNITGAENTLAELEKLCPSDPEIEKIKDEILMLK